MTIKEFKENTSIEEQKEFAKKLHCWLGYYTDEIIKSVWLKMEQIINDEFTLRLIDELYERTQKEQQYEINELEYALGYGFDMGIHNHCLTHSKSYRDVLYDMYIENSGKEV